MSTPESKGGPPPGLPPVGEVSLLTAHMPRNTETPNYPSAIMTSTPGIALAAARVPGGPTLPELDPISLTNAISQLANQMYAAPPAASAPPTSSVPNTPDTSALSSPPTSVAPSMPSMAETATPPATVGPLPSPGPSSLDGVTAFTLPLTSESPSMSAPVDGASMSSPAAMAPSMPSTAQGTSPFDGPLDFGGLEMPVESVFHVPLNDVAQPSDSARAPKPGFAPAYSGPHGYAPAHSAQHGYAPAHSAQPGPHGYAPVHPAQHGYAPAHSTQPGPAPAHSPSWGEPRFALDSYELAPTGDPSARTLGTRIFEPNVLKKEFPILSEPVRGKRLVWLDNAATTQKPRAVIDRVSYFYEHENSNIHRAAHTLAAKATDAYESARESVRRFINAPSPRDIVFVRGTTEGINFVAQSWGRRNVREGDEIVITWLEHHANIVPWQQLCSETGARLRVAPVDDRGQIILEEYEKLLGPRTKLVSFTQVSNALGTITPAADMIDMAHRHGAVVLLDGAQAVSHMPVDVQSLGCDFFVFSGHKVFGPTGIGAVFGRAELLERMPPWQGGGNMIQDVTFERTTYQPPPARFEAGTGNIADAVGLGAALDWLTRVGIHNVERYEHELLEYGTNALSSVPGLTLIGSARQKAGVLSFILDGKKTEEVGGLLDQEGIAVRSGHHCAQPILRRFGLEASVRASLAPYNTCEDIDVLARALHRLQSGR